MIRARAPRRAASRSAYSMAVAAVGDPSAPTTIMSVDVISRSSRGRDGTRPAPPTTVAQQ